MNTTRVSLAQPVVVSTIDYVLEDCPFHPYQQAFASPKLRQKLVALVLNRCANMYIAIADGTEAAGDRPESWQIDQEAIGQISAQRRALECLIRSLIEQVIQDN